MTDPAEIARCETCRWWVAKVLDSGDALDGFCQRRSPVVTGGMYGPEYTMWPTVIHNQFCGEHSHLKGQTDDA